MTRRTATRPEVRVGGHLLSTIAPQWGGLKTSTRRVGDWQASFTIAVDGGIANWRHPAIRYGAPVEVYYGPICEWVGSLTEPDWDSGEMVALGAPREAETALAITADGLASTAPNTVIDAAIARGAVSWTRADDFGTTPVGDVEDAGGLVSLVSVLDAWAEENNSGWRIDRARRLVISPTSEADPDWFIVPGSGVLGSADDERADRIAVRYVASSSGRLDTAYYPSLTTPVAEGILPVEKPADITDRGPMDAAKATAIAEGMWSDLRGESGWTNGLTLTRGQVTTLGGQVADLSEVRAGQTARLLGVPDPRGLAHNLDVVIGDTDYDWTEDTIQVNPVGLAARDTESVLESVGNLAVDAMKAAGARSGGYRAGTAALTFAGSGEAVLAHNLGIVPRSVIANHWSAGANISLYPKTGTATATTVTLIARQASGAAYVGSLSTVNWVAYR